MIRHELRAASVKPCAHGRRHAPQLGDHPLAMLWRGASARRLPGRNRAGARSRSARSRSSASRSRTAAPRASSSAWCARATRPISAFRVGGKIVARIVNVGDRVQRRRRHRAARSAGPQAAGRERARRSLPRRHRVWSQAAADLQRYDHAEGARLRRRSRSSTASKAANDEAEGRLARARRSLELARNQLGYAELEGRRRRRDHRDAGRARPGRRDRPAGGAARPSRREGSGRSRCRKPGSAKRASASATVRLWSDRDRRFQARLRELSPQADPATRTYAARFTILDADDAVAFGMTATVTLERAREAPVARLPLAAILNRGNGPVGLCGRRCRRAGAAAGDGCRLHRGRRAGHVRRQATATRVVTLGVQKLEAGLRVRTDRQPAIVDSPSTRERRHEALQSFGMGDHASARWCCS